MISKMAHLLQGLTTSDRITRNVTGHEQVHCLDPFDVEAAC